MKKMTPVLIFDLLYVKIPPMTSQATLQFVPVKPAYKTATPQRHAVTPHTYTEPLLENEDYLTKQILTYIGNKRSLLKFITKGVHVVQKK
jgi:hypothetical protein